jgi:hypothetical protein
MPDSLIFFGGAVKALDDKGRIGGYLVRFSDPSDPKAIRKDLDGEYFTKDTYFGAHAGDGVDVVFHHGRPLPVKSSVPAAQKARIEEMADRIFSAPIKAKTDDVGIWAETVLDLADDYEKAVFGLVKKSKIGWSSGAVSHLVKKGDDGQIKRWPIGEGSLTPTPAEPLNRAIEMKALDSVKFASLFEDSEELKADEKPLPDKPRGLSLKLTQLVLDRVDDGLTRADILNKLSFESSLEVKTVDSILNGEQTPTTAHLKAFARVLGVEFNALKSLARHDHKQTIKGMFEEAIAEQIPSRWELESTYCRIVKRLANAAAAMADAGSPYDLPGKIKEATDEYTELLGSHALSQVQSWLEDRKTNENEEFYLKIATDLTEMVKSISGTDLDTHSQLTVSALEGITSRFRANYQARANESRGVHGTTQIKAGRTLSEKNRKRIQDLRERIKAMDDDLDALLKESEPKATDTERLRAETEHLRQKWRTRKLE